jgi:hypothetical protein
MIPERPSWSELTELVKEWASYGDDAYLDAQSEIWSKWQKCKDPEYKKVLEDVYKFMRMLGDILGYM